jgi:hypothetical protein
MFTAMWVCRPSGARATCAMNGKRRLVRLLLARLDGQCDVARDRRADRIPRRQVISMSGDGGFAMLMGDFLSLRSATSCR